ncbi:hypothetical protein SUGI_0926170 [Cryptomeria japonica]|nr:hypothetical protein SUGI_0926170 [Cryptomeria japonica]
MATVVALVHFPLSGMGISSILCGDIRVSFGIGGSRRKGDRGKRCCVGDERIEHNNSVALGTNRIGLEPVRPIVCLPKEFQAK